MVLVFECPHCKGDRMHSIRVPLKPNGTPTVRGELWEYSGEFPKLTVRPSVNCGNGCWHGTITDGEMKTSA